MALVDDCTMPVPTREFDRSFRHSTTSSGPVASRKNIESQQIGADVDDDQMPLGGGRAGRSVDIGERHPVGVTDRYLQPRVARRVAQDDGVLLPVEDQGGIRRKRTADIGEFDAKHALETGERSPRFFGDFHLSIGPSGGVGDGLLQWLVGQRRGRHLLAGLTLADRDFAPLPREAFVARGGLGQPPGRPQHVRQQRRSRGRHGGIRSLLQLDEVQFRVESLVAFQQRFGPTGAARERPWMAPK